MRELVLFNENFKKIDGPYFSNYGGKNYSDSYINYTTNPRQVIRELVYNHIIPETLLDIGCASGEVVRDFRSLGVDAYGIENNKDILKNCVAKDFCSFGDMRDLSHIPDSSFEVIYCNALMYAFPSEVLDILRSFRRIASKAVYHCCPYLESTADISNDKYRVFLAKKTWWDKQFKEADFIKVSDSIYSV